MGLDISHDTWRGSYSAFTRWLNKIAEVLGWENDGQYAVLPEGAPDVDTETVMGIWRTPPADPIFYLFCHSDCEGELTPAAAAALADRLEGILPLMPEGDGGGHIGDWHEKTQQFIDGCRRAAAAGEPLEFY